MSLNWNDNDICLDLYVDVIILRTFGAGGTRSKAVQFDGRAHCCDFFFQFFHLVFHFSNVVARCLASQRHCFVGTGFSGHNQLRCYGWVAVNYRGSGRCIAIWLYRQLEFSISRFSFLIRRTNNNDIHDKFGRLRVAEIHFHSDTGMSPACWRILVRNSRYPRHIHRYLSLGHSFLTCNLYSFLF